jgi:putative aminopeptidase FrvX
MDEFTKTEAIELLRKLTEAHGAPGYEDGVREVVRAELGEAVATDRSGSTILKIPGSSESPRVMVAAHMDEVGLVVQSVTKAGLIKFLTLGGWWAHTLLAKRVRIRTRAGGEVVGVIGAKPPHFLSEAERDKLMKVEDMFIDVGAKDGGEVRERFGIRAGDSIVPDSPFVRMHNPDYLLSKAFDNRAGMALAVHIAKKLKQVEHPNTVFSVGTVQEEVGIRGAHTAAFQVDPDVAIVLEGTPADDLPGVAEDERQGALGAGVQVRLMDPSAIMNRRFVDFVVETAEKHGIAHQIAVRKSGGTDAKAINLHGAGVPVVVLGVPARYIHTHNCIMYLGDYLSALDLVLKVLQSLDAATAARFSEF